jgi:hypothetical protein
VSDATIALIVAICGLLGTAMVNLLNSFVAVRKAAKEDKLTEGEVAASHVTTADMISRLSADQLTVYAKMNAECLESRDRIDRDYQELRTNVSKVAVILAHTIQGLRETVADHEHEFEKQKLECSFFGRLQLLILSIVDELEQAVNLLSSEKKKE